MTRRAERNQGIRDGRRELILSAAVKLFATRGLAATKVTDIAAAAGMSQGLLYHYFRSKDDIFIQIVRLAFERMNSAARALERQAMSPREKLETAVSQILRNLEASDDFAWYSTLISQASISDAVPPEAMAIIRRERDVPYKVVARIARAGQKDGTVRQLKADELALVFWTTVKGLALHKTAHGDGFRSPHPSVLAGIFFGDDQP